MPSITVEKNCVNINAVDDKEIHYIKKECILGYKGYIPGYANLAIKIYTNIPGAEITLKFEGERYSEEYRKYRAILDSILSPEVQESSELRTVTADNIVINN